MTSRSIPAFLSGLNKTDGYLFAAYWLLAIPVIWYFNLRDYEAAVVLKGLLFTLVLDNLTVLMILYLVTHLLIRRQYFTTFITLLLMLAFLGYVSLAGYGYIFNKPPRFHFVSIIYGMLEHSRGYGILAVLATGKKIYETTLKLERAERLKAENELKLLRSQVHPHFLFNTLNNLRSLIEGTNPRATDLLLKLSSLLRYTLYKSGNQQAALTDELRFLQDYFYLQEIRCNDPSKLGFTVRGDPGDLKIVPGILISFIENAFKHGLDTSLKEAIINISIDIQDRRLHFRARNIKNGAAAKSPPGIGIKNAREQLRLQYKNRHSLDINDQGSTFFVNLTIQLHG